MCRSIITAGASRLQTLWAAFFSGAAALQPAFSAYFLGFKPGYIASQGAMDFERAAQMSAAALVAAGVTYYVVSSTSTPPAARAGKQSEVERVVHAFLDAQSKRDLDAMCALVADDILYINEPHPPERAIRSKEMFRLAFADSPCIWCPEAKLQVLQSSHQPGSDTVFVERLDQFLVDGHWLRIPICGYLQVKNGKIQLWKECASYFFAPWHFEEKKN